MSDPIRFTDAATIALHATGLMAVSSPYRPLAAPVMAKRLGVSLNHLTKVMQRLGQAGIVRPVRGPSGGYLLAHDADAITLLDVVEAIEGPYERGTCMMRRRICRGVCLFGNVLGAVKRQFHDHLAGTTLAGAAGCLKSAKAGRGSS